jgi:hypothetical protein
MKGGVGGIPPKSTKRSRRMMATKAEANRIGLATTAKAVGAVAKLVPGGQTIGAVADVVGDVLGGAKREPLVLHAVVIDKSMPLDEARAKAQEVSRLRKKLFMRETSGSYRFRIVPKTRFKRFVSKPISEKITLVLGELKDGMKKPELLVGGRERVPEVSARLPPSPPPPPQITSGEIDNAVRATIEEAVERAVRIPIERMSSLSRPEVLSVYRTGTDDFDDLEDRLIAIEGALRPIVVDIITGLTFQTQQQASNIYEQVYLPYIKSLERQVREENRELVVDLMLERNTDYVNRTLPIAVRELINRAGVARVVERLRLKGEELTTGNIFEEMLNDEGTYQLFKRILDELPYVDLGGARSEFRDVVARSVQEFLYDNYRGLYPEMEYDDGEDLTDLSERSLEEFMEEMRPRADAVADEGEEKEEEQEDDGKEEEQEDDSKEEEQ